MSPHVGPHVAGTGRFRLTAKHAPDPGSTLERRSCAVCGITWYGLAGTAATCPLCDAFDQIAELRKALVVVQNELEFSNNELSRLTDSVNIVNAMRTAIEVADDRDIAFMRSIIVQYNENKSKVAVRALHGPRSKQFPRSQAPVHGLLMIVRPDDAYEHICSSPGGMAIAGYYEEAMLTTSQVNALAMFVKALAPSLVGDGRD
jgi:hypothetical protein